MLPDISSVDGDRGFLRLNPVTPDGSLKKTTRADCYVYSSPAYGERTILDTPRKKTAKDDISGGNSMTKRDSSPVRCSPKKRMSPSSSSSPSRRSGRKERPPRQRSRSNSVTTDLVEGLAGTTMECTGDDTPSESDQNHFGAATLRSVKLGLNKCTPLLKALSDPWKSVSAADSDTITAARGHRRSSASQTIQLALNNREPQIVVTQSDPRIALTVEGSGQIIDEAIKPGAMLGPPIQVLDGCTDKVEGVRGCRAIKIKSRRRHAEATRGLNSYDSNRSLAKLLYPSRRSNILSYSSLAPSAIASSQGRQDRSELRVRNNDFAAIAQIHREIIAIGHPSAPPKGSPGPSLSSINSNNSLESTASKTPSIILTPPPTPALTADQVLCETLLHARSSTSVCPAQDEEGKREGSAYEDIAMDEQRHALPSIQDISSKEACATREREDALHLDLYKVTVDKLLSEFLNCRSAKRACRVTIQIVNLLTGLFHSGYTSSAKGDHFLMDEEIGRQEEPSLQIPSLQETRHYGEANSLPIPLAWRVVRYESMLQTVMDHVVTGLLALVTDDRAPFEIPQALTGLCWTLEQELPSPMPRCPTPALLAPQSPISSWVQACATSAESPKEVVTCSSGNAFADEEEDEETWLRHLSLMNPSKAFTGQLRDTIQSIFERGEVIRSKANLLAVPPARKGSRKRWLMATAEVSRRRCTRDTAISQVKSGVISEGHFRHLERQWAAAGDPKDVFAGLSLIRFIGELYNDRILDVHVIRRWLLRFFQDTVFPGVPSSYELEAGCALIITVGKSLEEQGSATGQLKTARIPKGIPPFRNPGDPIRALDFTATREWAWDAQRSPNLADSWEEPSNVEVAKRTMRDVMDRLRHIHTLEEVGSECRAWAEEVIALRSRGWQQKFTHSQHRQYQSHRSQE